MGRRQTIVKRMHFKIAESQEDILLTLRPLPPGAPVESGDRIIKNRRCRLDGFTVLEDPNWAPRSEWELHNPFIVWNVEGGPVFVATDDELHRLTGLESLMVRGGLLSFAYLDRRYNGSDCQG